MCDDDVGLYDDLPVLDFGESVSKIDEERQLFKKQLDEKEADLNKTKEQIAHLEKEKKILEENISSLYQTAVSEIKRKDRLIQELRREKESIIFRRSNKRNQSIKSTTDVSSSGEDNNSQQISGSPAKHCPTSVESSKPVLSSPVNVVTTKSSESKIHDEYSLDFSIKDDISNECPSSSHVSDHKQEDNEDLCRRTSDVTTNVMQTNNKTSENNSSEITHTLSVKLSSDSSQASSYAHRSGSKEHSCETALSKNKKTNDERRDKYKQKDYNSEKHCYSKSQHRSPVKRNRSLSLPNGRYRKDRLRDCNDKNFYKYECKETSGQESKLSAETCFESRRKDDMNLRKSPSTQWSRGCNQSPVRKYFDRRNLSSNSTAQSDNVRVAAQLKTKYSRAIRERSLSRTPVKQHSLVHNKGQLESSLKPKLQNTSFNLFPALEERFVSVGHVNDDTPSNEKTTGTLPKYCARDGFGNICSKTIKNETSEKSIMYKCDPIQSRGNNSEDSDNICQTYKNENIKTEESLMEVKVETNYSKHNSSAKSNTHISNVSKSKSLENKSEVVTNKEEIYHGKLPMQQSKTPPSKSLIPLKVSPSFEDPAIVKEKKFSFCVFNEQCEFKRRNRKRSVKVLVSEIKDYPPENKKGNNELNGVHICEEGVVKKGKIDSNKHNDNILEQRISNEKRTIVNCKDKAELNSDGTLSEVANDNSTEDKKQETSIQSKDSIRSSDTVTWKLQKICEVDVQKRKSANKRKLDSICEGLKANLEKKNVPNYSESFSDGTTNIDNPHKLSNTTTNKQKHSSDTIVDIDNDSKSDEAIPLIETPKLILTKRRRKACNLQDNIIHVLSQVKSSLS